MALESELRIAVVESGRVFRFHSLKISLESLLENFNHLIIHHTTFCVSSQHLAKFDRLVLVDISHDNVS